jgi:hypothetical protein
MLYKSKEEFLRDHGVRNTFYCEYFKGMELKGKTKDAILGDTLKDGLVKSGKVLDYTFKFYEKHKSQIGWI